MWIGAVWIELRNELREWIRVRNKVMRGWIGEMRVIGQRNEWIELRNEWIRVRNGKGKLIMRQVRVREVR